MAVILALDTSTEACSCALSINGETIQRHVVEPRQHARLLLPMVRDLLAEAGLDFSGLDVLAFGRGPGSFTGLRIAAGVAQGIAFAAQLPVVPVSTLAALALDAQRRAGADAVLACLDARIDEVYWGLFGSKFGLPLALGDEHLCKPEAIVLPDTVPDLVAAGNGLAYLERFPRDLRERLASCHPDLLPRAASMADIAAVEFAAGRFQDAESIRPVYLRDKVTHEPARQ